MRVELKRERAGEPKVRGWLKPDTLYLVLSVEATGAGASGTSYRIESEDNRTPALYEPGLFRQVDGQIPSCWIAVQAEGLPLELMPASWAEDGFWERFFDGDPAARREYEAAVKMMAEELGALKMSAGQGPRAGD